MRALGCALAIVLAGQATAQPRYDRKLEEAVMAIVAAKIGDIRGGFAFGERPVMVVVRNEIVMGTTDMVAVADRLPEGMARATDRRIASPATF
ncbi:MAG: hypothetical protein M3Y78_02905 [Pseudomonadota bacterium]|nr:hypothetical protein [Pseudomonadota bacterium]